MPKLFVLGSTWWVTNPSFVPHLVHFPPSKRIASAVRKARRRCFQAWVLEVGICPLSTI